jgi:hypothetical protein
MDDYSEGYRPSSSNYKKDPASLVNARPEFGGNKRPGYPRGISQNVDNEDTSEYEQIHGTIPGENVLMDQDPPTGEGVCHDEFVAEDEFNTDDDKIPIETKKLDNIDIGPHNMQKGNIFRRIRDKTNALGML